MPDEVQLSESIQDYLKAIHDLAQGGVPTSTNDIAERLHVAAASVTGMLKRLAGMDPPLVDYHKHYGVQLTDAGRQISLQIIRKHRLIELFLVKTLGYAWDEVHEEAERLEHAVSFHFCERLSLLLGEPEFDPHGDPIPSRDLQLPMMRTIPLRDVQPGQRVVIRRVQSSDAALLRYLGEMGVRPGIEIIVQAQIPFDRTVHVNVLDQDDQSAHVLGADISNLIQVEMIS